MGRFPHTGWLGRLDSADKIAIEAAIDLAGVGLFLKKPLVELSDGERQKVMIARALAQDTPVIILDEPTAFLDLPARFEILSILHNLARDNDKTVLFSTHDLSIAADIADKLWIMADNQIYQGAPEDLLISDVFRKLFLNSPAEFDLKTSTFRFRRDLRKTVGVTGDQKFRLLTKRAMERIGFQTLEEGICELTVDVQENNGLPVWRLVDSDIETEFNSIYTLAAKLRSVHNS
jgi:iron complex transport system ATP-binding protein